MTAFAPHASLAACLKRRVTTSGVKPTYRRVPMMLSRKRSAILDHDDPRSRVVHHPAASVGAQAVGALALATVAVGAFAIGALAIGALAIGRARIRRLEIDELVVRHLRITEELQTPPKGESES